MKKRQAVQVKTKKAEGSRVELCLTFNFDKDDPQAAAIYRGIAACLREALTPDEIAEFQKQFEAARARLLVNSTRRTIAAPC